ncbi:MAG: hypothetical protein HY689_15580 [Chloroflexi bacterium]|nr:hypothetical protein [Chloroflexota bacterium]
MGRAAQRRKLRDVRHRDGHGSAAVGLPGPYRGALITIGLGMALAVGVVLLGLLLLARGDAAAVRALDDQGTPTASAPVHLEVEARHLGNLNLEISAAVTMNEARRPLGGAEVVAYTDMVEMPLAHTQGPLSMQEVPGRPGVYATRTAVPMVGSYEVRVEVRQPVQGTAREVVFVGAGLPPQP